MDIIRLGKYRLQKTKGKTKVSLQLILEQNLRLTSPRSMAEAETEGKFVMFGNIKVYVVKNDIADEKADVIVCSVPSSLDLNHGRAAKSLEDKSGNSLQKECKSKYPNGITNGKIAVVSPGKLSCEKVFFITLPRWDSTNAQAFRSEARKRASSLERIHHSTCFKFLFINLQKQIFSSTDSKTRASEIYKEGNITIKICLGKLAKWRATVLVSSGTPDLQLCNGSLSDSLLEEAGSELQDECDEKYPDGIQHGDVAVTAGYNLQCEKVYHGALPSWDKTHNTKELEIFIDKCLSLANNYKVKSIAFPALGTGALKYPAKHSASVLHRCIKMFVNNNPTSSIKTVYIVIYDEGNNCEKIKQGFTDEFASSISPFHPVREHKVPKQRPISIHPRGSKEYFDDLYKSDIYPPCYWTRYNVSKSIKQWNAETKEPAEPMFMRVDPETFNEVKKVVELTWQKEFIGHGKDAKGLQNLNYTKINVTKVERIENIQVFEKYANYRHAFFNTVSKQGQVTPFDDIKGLKKGPLKTSACISKKSDLVKDIYPEINEHYLFHGTKVDVVESIARQGLDDRLAENAMFGKGVYCAESSTKADQYADDKQRRLEGEKKMFLVRACLGEVYIESCSTAHQRPPCRQCKQDKCTNHSNLYDSVVGEGSWNFREFVLYERMQVYPEYLITYRRA
ncbi:hypothetical protein ACJMK2_033147 [Sinanodonta woodiana]|uniref:Poly [ADP-ribose] polymerase n=2 Tax=Sinanodonta woodiana TaxID=1069815 RepID=A0ABD3X7R6_SINWO